MSKAPNGSGLPMFDRLFAIESDDCTLWPYALTDSGYGRIRVGARTTRTHVLSCERTHGPKPTPSHQVAHSCRNRHCLNPRHLRWATPKENCADRGRDGTDLKGTRNHKNKLSEDQVREIRRRCVTGEDHLAIAEDIGISRVMVSRIKTGRAWSWLDDWPRTYQGAEGV